MKKFLLLILLMNIIFCVNAISLTPVSATLQYVLEENAYYFGFAANESAAIAKTDAYETATYTLVKNSTGLNLTRGSLTFCFYWKVLTGEKLQIALTSSGPLTKKDVASPTTAQKINYTVSGSQSTTIGWWNGGTLGGSIDTSTSSNSISTLLKAANYTAIYTQGICNLTVSTTEDVKTKEYGTYTSTLTLTITNYS